MAGNAPTTMLVFSSGSLGAAPADALEHPEASVTIATADAMIAFRDFISLQTSMDVRTCDPGVRDSVAVARHPNARHRPLPANLDSRLGRLLADLMPGEPEVAGLLAPMLLTCGGSR